MSTGALTTFFHGQLANSKGTLYGAVGAGKAAYIKEARVYNTNTTSEVIVLYVTDGVNSYEIFTVTLAQNEYAVVPDDILLVAGETLQGVTTTGSKVNGRFAGILETIS